MMMFAELKKRLPDFAKDVKLNLSLFDRDETLSLAQKSGLALACGIATRNPELAGLCATHAETVLDEAGLAAARAASSVMAMNNIYYRFTHLVSNQAYSSMSAGLRMNVIANPGVPTVDFELWCLAVSAINGCGLCLDAHEKALRNAGLNTEAIQTAVRLCAIIQSAAIAIEAARLGRAA
jgi:alkyl hydroperoxide reductase subunit D